MKNGKIFTLLMAMLILISLFAGCGAPASNPVETPASDASAVPAAPSDSAAPAEDKTPKLPITDDRTDISDWKTISNPSLITIITDWNQSTGYQELEKRTNIHVNFQMPGNGNEMENFNILIASNDYPDIIECFSAYYLNGIDNAIDNNIALRLNDVIDQYMPNYKSLISDPARAIKAITDSGNIGTLYCIYDQPQYPWAGLIARKDWLDSLNLTVPRTYDDWYNALTLFKTEKGATKPLLLFSNGDAPMGNGWVGGFGIINGMMQKDGTVYYGPMLPEYRTYLETFSKWYAEGLIDPDFTTNNNPWDQTLAYSGAAGGWWGFRGGTYESLEKQPADPNFVSIAVQNPVLKSGDVSHFRVWGDDVGLGAAISTSCKNVDIVAKWLDYCYSEEGSVYLNFGTEGETFYYDENGEPTLDAAGMEKAFGLSYAQCKQATGPIEAPYLRRMYRNSPIKKSSIPEPDVYYDSTAIFNLDKQDWIIPGSATQTADEASEYSAIFNDINTLVNETTIKIIVGTKPLSAYDDLVKQLKSMGIDHCVEIKQAALTRDYNRAK